MKLKISNKTVLIENEDYDLISNYNWYVQCDKKNSSCYVRGYLKGGDKNKRILMHTVIMNPPNGKVVDHINHNGLDNRKKTNLRIVSRRQNNQNIKNKKTSDYPGVYWEKTKKQWRSIITIDGKRKHLLYSNNELECAIEYEKACRYYCNENIICKLTKDIKEIKYGDLKRHK